MNKEMVDAPWLIPGFSPGFCVVEKYFCDAGGKLHKYQLPKELLQIVFDKNLKEK
ncbi:MAG TPA: hypothetical protein V6C91_10260 [Coleofasciculaceae cyanobacterium]